MTDDALDLAIVGAGIVGAACAYAAVEDGLRVAVVDARAPASGTTATGMGHVVVLDSSPAELALTRYSQRLWAELGPHLPPGAGFRSLGTLWLATTEAEVAAAERKARALHGVGIPAEVLDAEEVAMTEPMLRDGLAGGLLVPEDLLVDPPSAARYLLEIVRSKGGRIISGRAVRRVEPGALLGDDGLELRARGIVNAAGVRAPDLDPRIPIAPRKGHLVRLAGGRGRLRHQVVELGYATGVGSDDPVSIALNLHPRADGSVLVGASREWGVVDPAVDPAIVARLRARAQEFAPGLGAWSEVDAWTGFRPASRDHLPWIGPVPDAPGVWIAAGHEGLGVTEALGTGRLLVDQFAGRTPSIPPEPYRPSEARLEAARRRPARGVAP